MKHPIGDDTANTGERLNESDPVSLANPTYSKVTLGAFRYSSKGVQYSAQLLRDAGISVEVHLLKIFAQRIAKVQNAQFTNGDSGGPAGVVPSLTQIQTSASPTAVTVAEIVGLQAIDAAYLPGAVYMMNPAIVRVLRAMVGTDGLPVFPELRTGNILCGFPVVANVDLPSTFAANGKAVLFGNFAEAVVIRDVTPQVLTSRERYAELRQVYSSMRHDADCQVVIPEAVNVLQQHS